MRWVGVTLYLVVLAGAGYFVLAGICTPAPVQFGAFVVGIGALLAVELYPRGGVVARLVVRAALIHAVALVDCSQLSRALFLLVPFAVQLALGRRAGLLTAGGYAVGLVGWLAVAAPGWYADAEQVSDLLMFGVGLVFAVAIADVALTADASRHRAERLLVELSDSQRRLAEYAATEERNRLARDIHDSLGHHLTAVSIQLEKAAAYRDRDPAVADRAVADARGSARAALAEVRGSVSTLRAPVDLATALASLTGGLDTGAPSIDLIVHGEEEGHEDARTTLYRAAQEGLTNAVRHADASRIAITVEYTPSAATLTVVDDGRGMPASPGSGFGLAGMRERLAAAGGTLALTSAPGEGTTLTATVPR